jgi:hypothetical protein
MTIQIDVNEKILPNMVRQVNKNREGIPEAQSLKSKPQDFPIAR